MGYRKLRRAASQVWQHMLAPLNHRRSKLFQERSSMQLSRRVSKRAVRMLSRKLSPPKPTALRQSRVNTSDESDRCRKHPYEERKLNTTAPKSEARVCRQVMLELRFGEIRITVLANPTTRAQDIGARYRGNGFRVCCVVILFISATVMFCRWKRY